MLSKDILKRMVMEFQESELPELIEREIGTRIKLDARQIVSIIGIRRSGKTYLMYSLIKKLLERGVERRRILYIDFEDDRITPFTTADFDRLLDAYFELYPGNVKGELYIFLDEIQNAIGWEKAVRRFHDRLDARIFIMGSSSKMLSREIATSLRGRALTYEITPFSFSEILRAKGVRADARTRFSASRFKVMEALRDYLEFGGFPEVALEGDGEIRIRMLRQYLETMVARDLAERFGLRNVPFLRELMRHLATSAGKYFSASSFYRSSKETFRITKRTVLDYIDHLQDVAFVYLVKRFSHSLKEQAVSPRKVYCADNGFRKAYGFFTMDEMGRALENAAFVELRRRQTFDPLLEIYYWRHDDSEVDFVLKVGNGIEQLIQVCWDMSDAETRKRELGALAKASRELGCNHLLVISWDSKSIEMVGGKKVEVVPMYEWMLEG